MEELTWLGLNKNQSEELMRRLNKPRPSPDLERINRDFHAYDAPEFPLRYIVVIQWAYRMTDKPGERMFSAIAMNEDGSEFEHCVVPEWGTPGKRVPFLSLPKECQTRVLADISESFS